MLGRRRYDTDVTNTHEGHVKGSRDWCGRKGQDRNLTQFFADFQYFQVGRTEIIAPLGYTVGLVHGHEPEPIAHRGERVAEPGAAKPLGRDVHQREHTGAHALDDLGLLEPWVVAVADQVEAK